MKREIKFRAWIYGLGKMTPVKEIDFDGYMSSVMVEINSERHEQMFFENTDYPDCELMQYTGLKDKNGVEVYEGDIVAFEDSDGGYEYPDLVINTGIVEYGELGFYFTNRVAVEMDDFYIKDGRCDEVEIIGNIYENQELLEVGG